MSAFNAIAPPHLLCKFISLHFLPPALQQCVMLSHHQMLS
jgi:hypothetical protein